MLAPSGRLLRLLTLLQARSTWTGEELAARLEVTTRTLRRDVERLRGLGYPVDATRGVSGGYALGRGAALPPLSLDEDEATAMFVGLHAAPGSSVSEASTAAMRALTKLDRVLPARLRRRLRALETAVVGLSVRSRPLSLATLATLAHACVERHVVTIAYRDRAGAATERSVEPLRVVRAGALWYLVAWATEKQDFRTFRLDRVGDVVVTPTRFAARPPPDDDLAAWVTRAVSAAPHPIRATVLLRAPLDEVRPRVGAFDAHFARADGGTKMELGAPTLDVLVARILWLGIDFDVLDGPEALGAHLRRVARRITRAAQGRGVEPMRGRS